jgi:hypothetical protein
MRPLAALLSGVAVYVACVGSAAAQGGAGLYEPFPQPADPSVSRDFVGELRAPGSRLANELSIVELERGTRVRSEDLPAGLVLPAVVAQAPSERAEPGAFLGSAGGWLGAAALLALAAVATRRLARR